MNLAAFLASMAAPIVARVMMALGFSVITITGVTLSVDQLKDLVLSNLSSVPVALLQLSGAFGAWIGLGMIFGAITFAVTFKGLTSLTGFIGKA